MTIKIPVRMLTHSFARCLHPCALLATIGAALICAAQKTPPANPEPDVLVLKNGDTLHGKFVSETGGKVSFDSDAGDLSVPWSNIKELHVSEKVGVLDKTVKPRGRKTAGEIPVGTVDVQDGSVAVHAANGSTPAPIPVANAAYIVDDTTLDKQIYHQPNFFTGWNGVATGGATLVQATQDQYTASGSLGLARTVPGVSWLDPRDRTSTDFSGSFGKITEPGTPAVKTAIFHVDAERDEYVSPRVFALGQVAFDHNFAQSLALQSVYGGGLGWTVIKNDKRELDVKATIQYENQRFITTPPAAPTPGQNLIGSTFAFTYLAKFNRLTLTQSGAFVPAYNNPGAYSANETDTLAFPAYKRLSFSVGTLDSYLNDTPLTATPPVKPNSFQFTLGLTYAILSKY